VLVRDQVEVVRPPVHSFSPEGADAPFVIRPLAALSKEEIERLTVEIRTS